MVYKVINNINLDISISPITLKIIKEIPWSEGLGKLIDLAFVEEPVPVSFIIGNFNKVWTNNLTNYRMS